jgi:hypothetical protein
LGAENKRFFIKNGHLTIKGRLLFFALRHEWMVRFLIKNCKYGEFETPYGTKYKGFKCSWKF